jgi:hypothetical protein
MEPRNAAVCRPEGGTPMSDDNPFPAERTAVITGAASPRGIGRATAERLARDGWSIAVLDLDGEAAERTSPTRIRSRRPSPRSRPGCRRSSAWPTWPG